MFGGTYPFGKFSRGHYKKHLSEIILKSYVHYETTLIESSNRSVLQISYLENYIFLTNKIFNTKYTDKLISIFHVYS